MPDSSDADLDDKGRVPMEKVQVKQADPELVVAAGRRPTAGNMATVFGVIKVYVGVGVLALPKEFQKSGLVAALIFMTILAVLSVHTLFLLVSSKQRLLKLGHNVVTFGDVCRVAFGKWGRVAKFIVDCLLVFTQVGFCCSYLIFLSRNVGVLFDTHIYWKYFVIFWIATLVALVMIRTVRVLGPFAAAATILLSSGLVVILIGSAVSWHNNIKGGATTKLRLFDITNVPNMIGVAIFSFEGIGFILPAHEAVKNRAHFTPLIVTCLTFISFVYIIFGTIGYLGFGNGVQDIALNSFDLLPGSAWMIVRKITLTCILLAIAVTYPMQLFVALDIIEHQIFDPNVRTRKKWWIQSAFRFCMVLLTALVALIIPNLNAIMAFIGSLGSASLQYIFPSLMYLLIYRGEVNRFMRILISLYVVFGVAALISGTYTSVRDMVAT